MFTQIFGACPCQGCHKKDRLCYTSRKHTSLRLVERIWAPVVVGKPKTNRYKRLSMEAARLASAAAQALSDPTRLMIAELLRDGEELCVCDLAWLMGKATNLVSHHLKALRTGDLVKSRRVGKLMLYSLTARGRSLVEALLEPASQEVKL